MEKEIIKHILFHSGVTITDNSYHFNILWKKIKSIFLTPQNKEWFEKRYNNFLNNLPESIRKKYNHSNKEECLYWELFSFGRLQALKNEAAVQEFKDLDIKECVLLQAPNFNSENKQELAYCLKGEFDVSLVDGEAEFNMLKEIIKKDITIPYWVIDYISQSIGKELYVFDNSLSWFLILTHENEVFMYKT